MKKLWFKAKRYGWGWYPATWQGLLVLIAYIAIFAVSEILFIRSFISTGSKPTTVSLLWFTMWFIFITGVLLTICYRTGEKPRWRWGK